MNKGHPLLEQIHQIEEECKTGVLPLTRKEEVVRIYFQRGLVDAVSSDLDNYRLGQYLVKEDIVDLSGLESLLKRSHRQKSALGETALQMGIIESWELRQLLRQQVFQLIQRALENGFEIQTLNETSALHKVSARIHLDALLLHLARNDSERLEVGHNQEVVLRQGKTLSTFPWSPLEISVLMQLQHARTVEALVRDTGIEEVTLRKMLSVFQQFDLIEIRAVDSPDSQTLAREDGSALGLFIPETKEVGSELKLEVLVNEHSFVSEQFRSLKTSIREIQSQRSVQVIGVSSARTQDGKSLVSANLALSFSRDAGRRVVLLDCDFRKPSVQHYFEVSLEPGIIGCLKEKECKPYYYLRRVRELYIMTSGGIAENPVELLSHPKMRKLIEDLRKEFDTIVLDSPPFEPISDARIISGLADGMVMVIRRGKTPHRSVESALKQVDPKKLLGVVFNDAKSVKFHSYHTYGYYGRRDHYSMRHNGYSYPARGEKHRNWIR